jgi:hypothetical protein
MSAKASAKASEISALQGALSAEHAAIYGYGIVGAMLANALQSRASAYWVAHQEARDMLEAMLVKFGVTPVAASPAYRLPFAVTGEATAVRLAVVLEDGAVQAYLGVVAVTDPTLRSFGALAMQPPANRAVVWRGSTVAFPGMPAGYSKIAKPYLIAAARAASTWVIAVDVASRSSAMEMRSAQDHQNHQRPSLPRSA